MSDWVSNMCIAAGLLCVTILGYRLYFNVPDSYDIGDDVNDDIGDRVDEVATFSNIHNAQEASGGSSDTDVIMQDVYSDTQESAEALDQIGDLLPDM